MTLPVPSGAPGLPGDEANPQEQESRAPAAPPAPPEPVEFPVSWFLQHAPPPLRYRVLTDVVDVDTAERSRLQGLAYAYAPAIAIAVQQQPDGTWNGAMLSLPKSGAEHFAGIGTVPAVRRLLEWGWPIDSPPLTQARRTLFRLLAEDDDPAFLYELRPRKGADLETVRRGRTLLREAAAATLAQAGYERDPRLRGAALRILQRLTDFLSSPLAAKPFTRVGNKHVLHPEANAPSFNVLMMLAHMPLFRSEHHGVVEQLTSYLSQPVPRSEAVAQVGAEFVEQPQLILGDPLQSRHAAESDIPWALAWLEMAARLGVLRRNEGWCKLLDRFLEERDSDGVWRSRKAPFVSSNPHVWPAFPLDQRVEEGEGRYTDATFRLGLIARLAGRTIIPV